MQHSLEYPGSCSGKRLRVELMLVLKEPSGLRGALVPIPRLPSGNGNQTMIQEKQNTNPIQSLHQ